MCGGDPTPPVGSPSNDDNRSASNSSTNELGLALSNWPSNSDRSFASTRNRFSFPTTAALQYADNAIKCTGVLVSKSKILTAGHCACREIPVRAFFGETAHSDVAAANGAGIRGTVPLKSTVTFFDTGFCERLADIKRGRQPAPALGVDAALLTLSEALPEALSKSILPVDPLAVSSDTSEWLFGVGFGYADEDRWGPGIKNYARLKYTARICRASQGGGCQADFESIAVSYVARRHSDSCEADSGGPLFVDHGGTMKLIGIVSRGVGQTCGDGGIYTSLEASYVRNWLTGQLSAPQ
jgi:hypothetical protein